MNCEEKTVHIGPLIIVYNKIFSSNYLVTYKYEFNVEFFDFSQMDCER